MGEAREAPPAQGARVSPGAHTLPGRPWVPRGSRAARNEGSSPPCRQLLRGQSSGGRGGRAVAVRRPGVSSCPRRRPRGRPTAPAAPPGEPLRPLLGDPPPPGPAASASVETCPSPPSSWAHGSCDPVGGRGYRRHPYPAAAAWGRRGAPGAMCAPTPEQHCGLDPALPSGLHAASPGPGLRPWSCPVATCLPMSSGSLRGHTRWTEKPLRRL